MLAYKIALLWLLYPLGMCIHTLVGLLPLFAGSDVAERSIAADDVPRHQRMMVLTTSIPMLMIPIVLMIPISPIKWCNLLFSVLLTLGNGLHLVQHVHRDPRDHVQNGLLIMLLALSIMLNYLSWQWVNEG